MEYTEALKLIGQHVRNGRLERGIAQKPFAPIAGVALKTLRTLETGERAPWESTQEAVEKALGWRRGVIREIIEHYAVIPRESVTLDYMREGGDEATWADLAAEEDAATRPVTRAWELSNDELIDELAYRLRHRHRGIPGVFPG